MGIVLSSCQAAVSTASEQIPSTRETSESAPPEPAQEERDTDADFSQLWDMLGKKDEETAELFGGGAENWTEDQLFYIGRIYEVSLFGETYPVYTSCSDGGLVTSVSIWISNGETEISEKDAELWADRLSEATGVEGAFNDTISEAGSKNWKWTLDGKSITMNWLGDLLTINRNLMIGELQ